MLRATRLYRTCLTLALLGALPATSVFAQAVSDPSTIQGKVLVGYQGWFRCPGDGSNWNYWSHWSAGNAVPAAETISVDNYPDVTGMDPASLCPVPGMTVQGKQAYLFTSFAPQTEETHFAWMREYGVDGVLYGRFLTALDGDAPDHEQIVKNIMAAAEHQGRVFAIDYVLDRSGHTDDEVIALLKSDWAHLVNDIGITKSPAYLREGGKPVVGIWGFGMDGDSFVNHPALAQQIIDFLHNEAHVVIKGGVSAGWRTPGQYGSAPGDEWPALYAQLDIVSPWTVGQYQTLAGVDGWRDGHIAPDMAQTAKNHQLYMPVILPGSSDANNDRNSTRNSVPRIGGQFLWRQAYNARSLGAPMVQIAMFDEVNEGTAIFKVASTRSDAPDQGWWLTLDADGYQLPSDWYLRLAYEIKQGYASGATMPETMPATPWLNTAQNCGVLAGGQTIEANGEVASCDHNTELVMQGDGNLVLYARHVPVWASGTAGTSASKAVMQPDGNLLVESAGGTIVWQSNSSGHPGAFVRVQDDGAASVVDANGTIVSTR
jgi:hypothetical protein